ncbi:MAG: isoprenylcysteine carboxylmethyltransferase family protein [Alphaproteobacteria bacterium]|nr:isoprenylcysteine carboxylmethyltransferase family protein [Alphaproteobacteria bacterium]
MIRKTISLVYTAVGYVAGLVSLAYIAGFLMDFGVPKGINDGSNGPLWLALVVDTALIAAFGLSHSIPARRWFKAWWDDTLPAELQRASYVILTSLMTALLVGFWRPIPDVIWVVEEPAAIGAIIALYLCVWLMMAAATFHFGHFRFFGLAQGWARARARSMAGSSFSARLLYAIIRHPISFGWITVPWITPHMTTGQLVFALGALVYVLIATPFEEADLIEEFGDDYKQYRERVPAFIPGAKSRKRANAAIRKRLLRPRRRGF